MCVSTVGCKEIKNDKENIGHAVNFVTVITYIAFLTLTMSMNVGKHNQSIIVTFIIP